MLEYNVKYDWEWILFLNVLLDTWSQIGWKCAIEGNWESTGEDAQEYMWEWLISIHESILASAIGSIFGNVPGSLFCGVHRGILQSILWGVQKSVLRCLLGSKLGVALGWVPWGVILSVWTGLPGCVLREILCSLFSGVLESWLERVLVNVPNWLLGSDSHTGLEFVNKSICKHLDIQAGKCVNEFNLLYTSECTWDHVMNSIWQL